MKRNGILTQLIRILSSMKFGMILLFFMAIFSISGTVLPQGSPMSFYEKNYPALIVSLIWIFHLDRVFTSWWFVILVAALALNLMFCSLRSLPGLLRRMKAWRDPAAMAAHPPEYFRPLKQAAAADWFSRSGFKTIRSEQTSEGTYFLAKRHTIGWLGSWLTHVGLFLIIVFYVFGKWYGYETMVYGVPGTRQEILDTGYEVRIDDFDILYREDYSVHQYITDATIFAPDGSTVREGSLQVNTPMKGRGFSLFQSGTGWALDTTLEKNGTVLEERTLLQSEGFPGDSEQIVLQFIDFYPDYVLRRGTPYTQSPFPKNPRMLYALYHNGREVMMNVAAPGEPIRFLNYTYHIESPRLYTVLQVVSDPGTPLVLLGSLLLLAGIFLSFYWVPQELYGYQDQSGEGWVAAYARRNQALFYEALDRSLGQARDQSKVQSPDQSPEQSQNTTPLGGNE